MSQNKLRYGLPIYIQMYNKNNYILSFTKKAFFCNAPNNGTI